MTRDSAQNNSFPVVCRDCIVANDFLHKIMNPFRASRLDIESEKMMRLFSLLRQMISIASVTAYNSALKMLVLFGSRTMLEEFRQTTAEATLSPIF